MAIAYNPRAVTNGLVLCLDAGNTKSYDRYENLLTNSSSTAAWVSGTFTTETTNKILGLNTVRITDLTSDGDAPYLNGTTIPVGTYTVSHYVDTINSTSTSFTFSPFTFHANSGGFTYSYASSTFTLSTKTFSAITYYGPAWSNASTSAVDLGNGIYRVSITATTSLAGTGIRAYIAPFPQDTSYLLVAGSQYESGSVANDYYATAGTPKTRGTTITDLSGNGNTGTLTNGPTFNNSSGGSLVFDGSDDYVSCGTFFNYAYFTISLWAYPGSTQVQYADIFDNNHTSTQNFVCQQNSTNTNEYGFACLNATNVSGTSLFTLAANTWHYLTFTWNNSVASAYINGVFHSSGSAANPINYVNPNLSIARWNYLGGRHWNGRISGFSAYNRVLTASEILQNFNSSRGRFGL